ncbi:hypothetical protein [Streptomyces mangrovisoli]|uniref:Uncharacterized protein n=1 Tax=Streptomyces mangrovisoli TaxID=1428628 RepID=A0A1J4NR11_9ACTN|nr:hypothetical protein [Streptomyces mangrovisoli]OIJ64763.1 hypothetical protein WN71_027080 [Streptomyces mangrovisoli]
MSASAAVRSLRAVVFAAVCVLLAAAGHGLAMGHMPSPRVDALAFAAVFGLGWVLGGRERSLTGITGAMLVTQGVLHFAFGLGHGAGGSVTDMGSMASMPGMDMGSAQSHALTGHATLAHLCAALLAAWWLRRGEAALFSLLRRTAGFVPGLVAWWRDAPLVLPGARITRVPDAPDAPPLRPLRHAVHRRGPPAGFAFSI